MNKKNTGFTLLEVMVALFIVAVALGGAIKVIGNASQNAARLADRTFANWVALNQMAELRIKGEWPRVGETKGEQEMSGRTWSWLQKPSKQTMIISNVLSFLFGKNLMMMLILM